MRYSVEYQGPDRLLIHLEDGSALRVVGDSYEEVHLWWEVLSPEVLRREALEAQGERERQRVRKLCAPGLEARRRAGLSQAERDDEDVWREMWDDLFRQEARAVREMFNRVSYG